MEGEAEAKSSLGGALVQVGERLGQRSADRRRGPFMSNILKVTTRRPEPSCDVCGPVPKYTAHPLPYSASILFPRTGCMNPGNIKDKHLFANLSIGSLCTHVCATPF